MKKKLTTSLFLLGSTLSFGQLKVDSIGNIGAGTTTTNPNYTVNLVTQNERALNIKNWFGTSSSYAIYATTRGLEGEAAKGISSTTYSHGNSSNSIALSGAARNYQGSHSIGVRGTAGSDASGCSIGVAGQISSLDNVIGAGVYGSTGTSLSFSFFDKRYAGYFKGSTKVVGELSVTGGISGLILNAAPPSSTSLANSIEKIERYGICSLFDHISVNPYFIDMPDTIKFDSQGGKNLSYEVNIAEDEEDAELGEYVDTGESLSLIEKQIYSKKHYGLNAEELEEVFPDLVYEGEDGTKSINYVEMVPLLVQAIKELKAEISELKGETDSSKKTKAQTTDISDTAREVTLLSLGQNNPNPFGVATSIAVSVPDDVQTAFLYVYNLNGSKVAQVDIPSRGATSVTLSAATLSEGMYLYSLVADGKIVQTRRMIVEK